VLVNTTVPGVDAANKEFWLNDADFLRLFKCTKQQWLTEPGWRKLRDKRTHKLF